MFQARNFENGFVNNFFSKLVASLDFEPLDHGGYPGNRNVRYASHSMADA